MAAADRTDPRFLTLALAALGPVVVALLLVPVRRSSTTRNLALILVLVVVLAGDPRGSARRRARRDHGDALVRLLPDRALPLA